MMTMSISKIKKYIQFFYYFKNPFAVIKFYRGKFIKGRLIEIRPRKNLSFFVARSGDYWFIDKIINDKKVDVYFDPTNKQNYIVEKNIYLRQGTSDTFIYKEIFIDKCYDNFTEKLTNNSIVIDIGAHICLFSLYCSARCGKVYAYEAHPDNYSLAVENIKNNNIKNINVFNLAVWSTSGEKVYLSDSEENQTGDHRINTGGQTDGGKALQVSTITLEDVFIKNNINFCDLLKIDIEGAEYAVLFNTPDFIFKKIKSICMEFHPDLENKRTVDDLVNFFKRNQFIIERKELNKSVGLLYVKKQTN